MLAERGQSQLHTGAGWRRCLGCDRGSKDVCAGGRIAFAHPESGIAAAYVANTMSSGFGPDPRWAWIEELRKAIAA